MLLLSLSEAQKVYIKTPWGRLQGVHYLGKNFLPTNVYSSIDDALQVCRSNLDAGLFSIVITEKDQVTIWSEESNSVEAA